MKQQIEALKQHPAWPELAAYAKTQRYIPDLEKVTEVELLGVFWAFVRHKNEQRAINMLGFVGLALDEIMFEHSAG